jgi:phosphotransferase system HPr (HPr) family protein
MPKTAQCSVTVLMPQGLHMRPADILAKAASQFQSRIEIARPNTHDRFDCKSILAVMTVVAEQGTELIVYAEGDDCDDAIAAVQKLFEEGFGELEPEAS